MKDLKSFIDAQFDKRSEIKSSDENQELKNVIKDIIKKLDNGELRIAEKINEKWTVNQWLKKAVLLSFIADENFVIKGEHTNYFDKIPNKFYDYDNTKFVKTPHPAGTVAPVNEKPKTVDPPADTVNPAKAASPPEALETLAPSTSNWNPAISYSELYKTSPESKIYKWFSGNSHPSEIEDSNPKPSPSESNQ